MLSIVIPTTSKNRDYTENLVNNIKEYNSDVEIIVEENDNVTLGQNYNNAVARATQEKIILLHNDMVISPSFVEIMYNHIKEKRITTYTRLEPPIFTDKFPGKVIFNCGFDLRTFSKKRFEQYKPNFDLMNGGQQLFFGCMKKDYIGIDGHTFKMFCEDDDLHLRYKLNGFEHKVSSAYVYHFVSKTSRSDESYKNIELASNRNFIRKWGHRSPYSEKEKRIIIPKYNIGIILSNINDVAVSALEPHFVNVYHDNNEVVQKYIEVEQKNTSFDLRKKFIIYHGKEIPNDIVIKFDCKNFNNKTYKELANISILLNQMKHNEELQHGNIYIKEKIKNELIPN